MAILSITRRAAFAAVLCAAAALAQAAWVPSAAPGAATLALADRPGEMALASQARVLAVGSEQGESVKIVNPDTGAISGTIALDKKPTSLALNPNATRLFVLQDSRKVVYAYDVASRALVASWNLSGDLVALALRPNGAELLVADAEGKRLVALNPATGAVIRQKALGSKPESISVNGADTRVLVGTTDGRLLILDAATLNVISNVSLGEEARWVSFWDSAGLAVVVQKKTDAVSLVNVETGTVVARVELSTDPEHGTLDAASSRAYVSTKDDLGVNQIDLAKRRSDGRFILPSQADSVLFDPVARVVYVSLSKDKALYRIDPAQHPLLSEVVLRKRLRDIAFNNATHEAATIAEKVDELSRVRLADLEVDTLALPDHPSLIAVDSGRNLAVLAMKKSLRFADLASRPPMLLPASLELSGEPNALAVDSTRGLTIVAGKGGNADLVLIDNGTRTTLATVGTRENLQALAIDARRGAAYVVTGSKNLLTFDIATRAFARTTALAFQPDAIAVDADLNLAALTDASKDRAYVINLANGATVASFDVPRGPVAVSIQSNSHVAVIAAKEDDQLSLLDLSALTLRAGYAAIASPFALATSVRFNQALVLSGEKDDITVVPLPNAVPQLDSIAPTQATAGSPALTLAVTGASFVDRSRVFFGTVELVTRWLASGGLEATLPASLLAATGGGSVRVRSPGPGGGDSNAITFNVIPPLAITAIDPASGPVGTVVRITGTSFDAIAANNQVAFRGVDGTTVLASIQSASATQLMVAVPVGAQTGAITVSNARGIATSPVFTVTVPLAITAINPASGIVGSQVTLTGTGFDTTPASNTVMFAGIGSASVAASVVSATATQLVVAVPAGAQTGAITVSNSRGSATSGVFTVSPPPPSVTTISPASGPALTVVTITGNGFDTIAANNTVTFGSPTIAAVLSATSTTLVARVPATAATGAVTVRTANGTATGPVFTLTPPLESDVQLLVSPAALTVYQGAAGSVQIQMASTGLQSFTGVAALSASGLPSGITSRFTPAASISAFQPSTLVLTAADGATTGDYTLTVTAQASAGDPITRTATVAVKVLSSAGITGVKGRFVTPAGEGIGGVIVRADNGAVTQPQTTTDFAGNFQLVGLSGGAYTLRFDATPANPLYPIWPYSITVVTNRIVVIPDWTINPPPADDKFTPIANTAAEQVVTDTRFPGLEIRLPAGTSITGWDGVKKSRIAVERVEISKLPVTPPPTPTGSGYQLYFGTPMGGIPSQPIPVTLPNDVEAEPGQSVDVWFFDGSPMGGSGEWKVAGQAIVSADGTKVSMPPGTGIPRFCGVCGLMCLGKLPPAPNPPPGPPPPCDGNPVDLSQGQEMPKSRGMSCGGLTPIDAGMSYNPVDAFNNIGGTSGSIGFGWTLDYDIAFLPFAGPQKRLILPGNNRVNFIDSGAGIYRVENDPRFDGATIRATNAAANLWELKFKDGRIWRFRPYPGVTTNIRGGPPTFVNEIVDAQGNSLSVNRQTEGKVVSIGTADRNVSFTYGANGFASEMRDTAGRVMRFAYNAKNRLSSVTDPDGKVTSYTYVDDSEFVAPAVCGAQTSFGERLKTISYPGRPNPTTNDYGPGRRVIRQVGYDGREFRFNYRVTGACVTHVSSPNTLCTGVGCPDVDSWENLQAGWRIHGGNVVSTTVLKPDGQSYSTEFNSLGVATAATDALGQKTSTKYDAMNRPIERTDALGRTQKFSYDANGNLTQTIDALGRITQLTYDPVWNKPASVTRFDDANQPVTWAFAYHPQNGNVVSTTNPLNQSTTFTYTTRGQLETLTNALGKTTRFEYDLVGDLVKVVDPLSHQTRMGYDGAGRRTSVTDALNFVARTAYNGVDDVTRVTDALTKNTELAYDPAGRLQKVTNARGNVIETYGYDNGDRLAVKTDALAKSGTYQYDSSGRVSRITDRKGAVTTFGYDSEGRVITVDRPEGRTSLSYDIVGRLTLASDSSGSISYAYDNADRLVSEKQTAGGVATTVQFQYDALDRRVSRTVSGAINETTTYGYDRAGRLTRITYRGEQTTFEYDAAGRLARKTLPNGIVQSLSADDADRLTAIKYANPDGSLIEILGYGYDDIGRRISVTRSAAHAPETPFTASYDLADRMTSITLTGMGQTFNLGYDDNGNLTSKVQQGNSSNLTTYVWDSQGRLSTISGPGVSASFQYDAMGRRTIRTINGESTRYVYDAAQAIAEIRPSRSDSFVTGLGLDEVIARYNTSGARIYLTDILNSVFAQTASDRTRTSSYRYSPYGESIVEGADEGNSVQYTGRENDGTGLYFYRARYYDPVLKRFIGEDPIGLAGGSNAFGYVGGNPISYADATGELPVIPIILGIIIIGGSNSSTVQDAASDAAQYWANQHNHTGNGWNAVPGALAALADPCNAWKTGLVLGLGAGAGAHAGRPFWQYYPAGNPAYSSPWLTRGWGWRPPYQTGSQAADRLALPPWNPGTAVRPVTPRPFDYVGGPRPVEPNFGRPGGGIEYHPGGFPK